MKKLIILCLSIILTSNLHAQFSGDGYFLELPNCNIWGTFVTESDPNIFGGVFYRISHSSGTIINLVPVSANGGVLSLEWTQYRTYENQWYAEYSGEMTVNQTLIPVNSVCPSFPYTESPSRQLIEGVYRGDIRTITKYIQGKPHPNQTAWSPVAFTINGGAVTTTGFNPFDRLLEGYVLSTNGNILGDYVLYREPATGGWGCMGGQYLHYYKSGGYYVTVICPTEFDVNTGEVKGIYYRYRVNASNLDRSRGIWKPSEWVLDIGGDIVFKRVPTRCPENAPSETLSGYIINGCLQAEMQMKYRFTGFNTMEAREPWVPVLFTLMPGTTAPGTVAGDDCDRYCDNYCRNLGVRAGTYNGSTPCLLGVVSNESKGCDCER